MEDANSPKPPPPRPPKLAVLSQLQLHRQQTLTPHPSSSQPQRLIPTHQHSPAYPRSSASPAPKPHECSMCGDVGLKKELFRCRKCSLRYQHTYCSNWYPKKRSYAGICNWCDTDYMSYKHTGTSNVMIKRIKTAAAAEVIVPLALIKSLSPTANLPCKKSSVNTEERPDATRLASTRNQQPQNTNKAVHEPASCKSRQLTEAATSVLARKGNVQEDCGIARLNHGDSSLADEGEIRLVMSDDMASSRIVEPLQQRPAADHHEAPIKSSNSQHMGSTAAIARCSKKAARRYKLVSDV